MSEVVRCSSVERNHVIVLFLSTHSCCTTQNQGRGEEERLREITESFVYLVGGDYDDDDEECVLPSSLPDD